MHRTYRSTPNPRPRILLDPITGETSVVGATFEQLPLIERAARAAIIAALAEIAGSSRAR